MCYRFEKFFGLRDFIHFINYIRRERVTDITPQLVLRSLERNFNGTEGFERICSIFLEKVQNCMHPYCKYCICYRWGLNWMLKSKEVLLKFYAVV